jgi:hypothetical protein
MRRILVAVVALSVVSAVVAGAAKAGTAEVEFSGGAGGFSPCNGEFRAAGPASPSCPSGRAVAWS